jgi:hypothetical protein
MAYFLKSGNTYRVSKKEALDIQEALPPGNYVINKDPMSGQLYLEHIEDFKPLTKIYGDCLKNTDRIINTFLSRPAATGVMLTGEKGSGKTLLTKNISIELAKQGIPTIVINAAWCGDAFNTFIQSIDQPCAVLFDEFEKTYDRDEQESILTLLDGVFPSKKLFMLTTNDKYRVDYHMRNRPGRIFYMLDFKGLSTEFITEYCQDNLNNKSYIDKICSIASLFAEFNFDMLKALVEEMNRYNENPQEALRMLNAKPEFDGGSKYDTTVIYEGKEVTGTCHPAVFDGNPLQPKGIDIEFDVNPESSDIADWKNVSFNSESLVSVSASEGKFVFEDGKVRLILTKIKTKVIDYYDAF